MRWEEAKQLIDTTFNDAFDEQRFRYFIKNLLNELDETKAFEYHGNYIRDAFKEYVRQYKRLGQYVDPEGHTLDVLVVELKRASSLERARTMQRNFVAWYLDHRDQKDAALVAYYTPESEDWRFSYVRMNYATERDADGKIRVKKELTPARRYSFLVGKNEPNHTPQQQLFPILLDDRHNPTLSQIEDAFSIEKVTREFFQKYKELFLLLKDALDEIVERDARIKQEFESKQIDTVNFAKKLLGQIVFLYFLQKKGWLGVGKDEQGNFKPWGSGPKNFLQKLFRKEIVPYDNFFNDILEPLFYEALAIERENDYYSRFNCKIPFLNGGLFEPIGGYDWQQTDILIEDEIFRQVFETFDLYNFTVREDEPLEKEVAVDPEMLGKVFENLLEIKDRKSKGAYYTPREIVHYMCQESLINYLDTVLNNQKKTIVPTRRIHKKKPRLLRRLLKKIFGIQKPEFFWRRFVHRLLTSVWQKLLGGQDPKTFWKRWIFRILVWVQSKLMCTKEVDQTDGPTKAYGPIVPREDIEFFIRRGEQATEHDRRIEAKGRETRDYPYEMPESIRKHAREIDAALADIKICDPAIGSGAFPVGMMQEIVKARIILNTYLGDSEDRTAYNFKRHCIQENLYGVDIDPGAVDIAKLRLWLSLVVDEDNYYTIKPLPNLDYKIVCGDSLLGMENVFIDIELEKKLENLKYQFFNETRNQQKRKLKTEIDKTLQEIVESAKAYGKRATFDFHVFFSEVFNQKKGFDVVIANPPYISAIEMKKRIKEDIISAYKRTSESAKGSIDIYVLFFEKGIKLLNKSGILSFITPNKYLSASYGKNLRKFLFKNTQIIKFVDLSKIKVFLEASVYPIITFLTKRKSGSNFQSLKLMNNDVRDLEIASLIIQENNAKMLSEFPEFLWGFVLSDYPELVEKIRRKSVKLSDIGLINATSTASEADEYTQYIRSTNCENCLKLINTGTIDKYISLWGRVELKHKGFKILTPYIKLNNGVSEYRAKMYRSPKIIFAKMAKSVEAYIDFNGEYASLNTNCFYEPNNEYDLRYIGAFCNSKLFQFIYSQYFGGLRMSGGYFQYQAPQLRIMPIYCASKAIQKEFIDIVDLIVSITTRDDYFQNSSGKKLVEKHIREIDLLVYRLYGLTEDEIKIIEDYHATL